MNTPKKDTDVHLLLKNLSIRYFLIFAIFLISFYFIIIFLNASFSLLILLGVIFIFLVLIFIKKYFQKITGILIQSNLYNKSKITELKKQYDLKEQAYQELESLNFVIDNAALFASAKLDGTVVYMSKKFCDLLGIDSKDVKGSLELLLTTKEDKQQNLKDLFKTIRHKIWVEEIELTTHKGEDLWLELSIIPMNQSFNKQILFILGNNITDRKEAQMEMDKIKDLEYKNKVKLQKDQASQIVEAQEEERKRIAKDIHDGIGQTLTALKFSVEAINIKKPKIAENKIKNLKAVFGQLLKDIRAVTFSLTPPELSDYGIAPALKKMTKEISKLSGKNILFENKTNFDKRLDSLIETNLYRITQEAITNALKYAESTYVLVTIRHTKNLLSIVIDDNGKGFDKEVIEDFENGLGMGLFFMKERAKYLNGRLFINSSEEGTRITVNIPL